MADLHGDVQRDRNSINKTYALNEKSAVVNGVGDMPNQHDILTGSDSHGRAVAGDMDTTCKNYTSNADGTRQRDARPPRPHGRRQLVVELRARIARLQPAQSGGDGRRGAALLLRGELDRSNRSAFGSFGSFATQNDSNEPNGSNEPETIYSSICQSASGCGPSLMWAISGSPSAWSDSVAGFRVFGVLTTRGLLLAAFDQRLLALALRGGGSCVSGHAERFSIHHRSRRWATCANGR